MGTLSAERAKFWDWFKSNADRLRGSFTETATSDELIPLAEEVGERLHVYDEQLFPLMGRAPDGICELIVTAEGNTDAFASVFELFKVAPKISDWRLIPLKPRGVGFDGFEAIQLEGQELTLQTTRCATSENEGLYSLAILVEDAKDAGSDVVQLMAMILVESLIGEYDLATRISDIQFYTVSEFRNLAGHDGYPLAELAEAIPPSLPN